MLQKSVPEKGLQKRRLKKRFPDRVLQKRQIKDYQKDVQIPPEKQN